MHRAQKQIHRLNEEKSSLLERVLQLESAAGSLPEHLIPANSSSTQTTSLLNPPALPSLEDEPRKTPKITTSTDLSSSTYNAPTGPAPLPHHYPPRLRSEVLKSYLIAQQIQEDDSKKDKVLSLDRARWSTITTLGLRGAGIAENVEKALRGEQVASQPAISQHYQERSPSVGVSHKRQREVELPKQAASLQQLPNPFDLNPYQMQQPSVLQQPHSFDQAPQGHVPAPREYEDDGEFSAAASEVSEDDFERGGSVVTDSKPSVVKKVKSNKPKKKSSSGSALNPPGTVPVAFVPRNPDGRPVLPLAVGIITIHNLGGEFNRY